MLIHCRKTCQVCHPDTFHQESGLGKSSEYSFPEHLSIQILKVARRTNLYWDAVVQNTSDPSCALTRRHCQDQDSKCAFWAFQGQCDNDGEFRSFMETNCPLSCQYCDQDLLKGLAFFQFVLDTLATEYRKPPNNNVIASRRRTLELLLTTVGMDPAILDQPVLYNWLETLHRRFVALVPPALWQIYESATGPITDNDYQVLQGLFQGVAVDDDDDNRSAFLSQILIPYRSRGAIVSVLQDMDTLVMRSIDLTVGFAIPNDAALDCIRELALGDGGKIVQMGAGTGYWTGLLKHARVDIVAYDLHPPPPPGTTTTAIGGGGGGGEEENVFFEHAYTDDIQKGSCMDVFEQHEYLAKERTLLMIWPNDPDPVDNRQFCSQGGCDGSQAVWDAECLLAYMNAGGQRVVYVGERERTLPGAGTADADYGMSSTRRFQSLLAQHFTLVKTVPIPTWWLNQDDLTIWERKKRRGSSSSQRVDKEKTEL
jgi:hypothetical protein